MVEKYAIKCAAVAKSKWFNREIFIFHKILGEKVHKNENEVFALTLLKIGQI